MEKEEFAQAIYAIVRLIPAGRATSYGAIARAAGCPFHARLAGRIIGRCDDLTVPVHRVVNGRGMLSAGDAFAAQECLLLSEGVIVSNNRIGRWREIFWDPLAQING